MLDLETPRTAKAGAATRPRPAPQPAPASSRSEPSPLIDVQGIDFWHGPKQVLHDVSFDLRRRECLAFIGPSGCGKSTLLKCLNRMQDDVAGARMGGRILYDGEDIHAPEVDPPLHRRRFGWVAQKPNPFAWSIRENIAYGARLHAVVDPPRMDAHVEGCLRAAGLWEEVKDRLGASALGLSGGQQQRLCIARALGTRPQVLLMDEPCGSIDPVATAHLEALILRLKRRMAIVVITHNMEQARRVADRVAFLQLGRLREIGETKQVFSNARDPQCAAYLRGEFG
ncbi:MAG: phosphate ABC transporter ATP-binding protein [Pseudomonadota bacterium]